MRSFRALADRLRATFSVRRQTLIGPVMDAYRLRAILRRITNPRTARVLAPEEFSSYLREITPLTASHDQSASAFDYVIVRQNSLGSLHRVLIETLAGSRYTCVYANAAYALFAPARSAAGSSEEVTQLNARLTALLSAPGAAAPPAIVRRDPGRAVMVTTFNRPEALRRSLPQIARLGHEVLVVDDGSAPDQAAANRDIAGEVGARYLLMPENRGLAAALNTGLSYLLADPRAQWFSYFQDDVDVDPALMECLRRLEDADRRPVITGYDAAEHAAEREETIAGVRVKLKRLSPAVHLHAHAHYWTRVLPIPTQYLGAPKRRWDPSLEDYWIVKDAPESVWRRGLLIPCVPGLVRTFLWHAADSTWGNPNRPDPPLAGRDAAHTR